MLNSKLETFVAKRIIFYFLLFTIVILFFNSRWYILLGGVIGAFLSALRFSSNAWIFMRTISESKSSKKAIKSVGRCAIVFIVNQLLLIAILFAAFQINRWLFEGVIGGVMLAPFTVIVNSITEALGITNNNYFM